jgi:hypothetical protein
MFVRYFVDVPVPADTVREMLEGTPEAWLPVLAERADAAGADYLTEVGFGDGLLRLDRRVAVSVRPGVAVGETWMLPIVWEAVGAGGLFPSLEADIEVAALGPSRTHLSLSGRYRPPGGTVGRIADRALFHRVAEATVKDFLDRVAARLIEGTDVHDRTQVEPVR